MPFRRRTRNRVSLSFQTMTFILASAGLLALMTACGSLATGSDSPPEAAPAEPSDATATPAEPAPATATPEPTVVFDFQASSALVGSPQDTPEGTFELYLRDAINQAVRLQHERLDIRIHYEDPEILAQDLGGLVVDVDLIEDRSVFDYATEAEVSVIYEVDIDILITYGDEETNRSQCDWTANLEKIDEVWYVINPSELPLFVNCTT